MHGPASARQSETVTSGRTRSWKARDPHGHGGTPMAGAEASPLAPPPPEPSDRDHAVLLARQSRRYRRGPGADVEPVGVGPRAPVLVARAPAVATATGRQPRALLRQPSEAPLVELLAQRPHHRGVVREAEVQGGACVVGRLPAGLHRLLQPALQSLSVHAVLLQRHHQGGRRVPKGGPLTLEQLAHAPLQQLEGFQALRGFLGHGLGPLLLLILLGPRGQELQLLLRLR
mmetsp:Transcript_28515/g.75827  ORF Transcript_28515/g.75827 Transcript_28515/m.75827 type:complete len:230 (+) Transcript_28515:202-891(+)